MFFQFNCWKRPFHARYDKILAATYIGDTRRLFDGSVRLQDAIRENVNAFISSLKIAGLGGSRQCNRENAGRDLSLPQCL